MAELPVPHPNKPKSGLSGAPVPHPNQPKSGLSGTPVPHPNKPKSGLSGAPVRALLLDIEGTTTPLSFLYEVLFPYARRHLRDFLIRHMADLSSELRALRQEHAADQARGLDPPQLGAKSQPAELDEMAQYVDWLMDQDRKTAPLKSLQGQIWKAGYESGELTSQVFQDVPPALKRWRKQGIKLAIFSSGSVLAQKLLFAHTNAGDLTSYLDAHFDTTIGTKIDPLSYRTITRELGHAAEEVAFVSDMVSELEAARAAGLLTFLCLRPGNRPQPESDKHATVRGFEELRF